MIEGMMFQTCRIRRRDADSRNSFGDLEWTESEYLSCAFMDRAGLVVQNAAGEDVVISGYFYLSADVAETDIIVHGGYEYEIVSGGITYGQDLIAEITDHLRVAVQRRRPAAEREVTA